MGPLKRFYTRRRLVEPTTPEERERGIALWRKHRAAFKSPRRKSNVILNEVLQEELEKYKAIDRPKLPPFRTGDSVMVDMLWDLKSDKSRTFKGLVIGRHNRGLVSTVMLYCVQSQTPHIRYIPLYGPHLKSIKILQKNFINKGKKPVRRAKLTYLFKKGYNVRAP